MFEIEKVAPRVYCAVFKRPYDLSMTFMRYQEFYEGESAKFRGQSFSILDFIEWYCHNKNEGLTFSYHEDWGGFNIPGKIIKEVVAAGIPDMNGHDHIMLAINSLIDFDLSEETKDYYLIGVSKETKETYLPHELAHGLFYTNPSFRREMTRLVGRLPKLKKEAAFAALRKIGYAENVLVDEVQAHFATGLIEELEACDASAYLEEFEKVFKAYGVKNE